MSAPCGPAEQEVISESFRMANLSPLDHAGPGGGGETAPGSGHGTDTVWMWMWQYSHQGGGNGTGGVRLLVY